MPSRQPIEPPRSSRDDWDRHWDEYALSAELNPAQEFRRRSIVSWIKQSAIRDLRIVDIGSGQGDLLADLHRALPGAALLGVDIERGGSSIRPPQSALRQGDRAQSSRTGWKPQNPQADGKPHKP